MSNKINYLSKEEIVYELLVRAVEYKPEYGVDSLRKLLRKNFASSTSIHNLKGKIKVSDELETVQNKLITLGNLFEECVNDKSPLNFLKFSAKLTHLNKRVSNLKDSSLSENLKQIVLEICGKLKVFSANFETLKVDIPEDEISKRDEQLNQSFVEEENLAEDLDKMFEGLAKAEDKNRREISTPSDGNTPVLPSTATISHVEPIANNNPYVQLSNLAHGSVFNKLTNPLEKYINNFQVTDGLDVNLLLLFLRNLVKITTETKLATSELYEILPSVCAGPLLNKVIECKQMLLSIDQMHAEVLNAFIPITLRERLKQDLIFRPQMFNEPLAVYVQEVKTNHLVLKSQLSERELVNFIKNGINPDIRNKLSFENNPTNFKDLDALCLQCNNILYNDWVRDNMFRNARPSLVCKNFPKYSSNNNRMPNSSDRNSPKLCYRCGKSGHLIKQCYAKPKN